MEKKLVFRILKIEETKDAEEIRAAYLRELKETHPEDHPKEFRQLRQAYEEALKLAGREEQPGENREEDEVELWLDRVAGLYGDVTSRGCPRLWRELLSDPVCEDLDTTLEAREKLLHFLMGHIYLPGEVWKLIDDTFGLCADREELLKRFPRSFLDYVRYCRENPGFLNYSLFSADGLEEPDGDGYIRRLLDIHRRIGRGQGENLLEELDHLESFQVYHPYEDVERLRLYLAAGETALAAALAERLAGEYEDPYILLWSGEAFWQQGERERAHALWKAVLGLAPGHYGARQKLVRYFLEKGEVREARRRAVELVNAGIQNEELREYLRRANEALIPEYYETLKVSGEASGEEQKKTRMELAWCLFQNGRLGEAQEILKPLQESCTEEESFCQLYGQLFYQMERCGEALPWLKRWRDLTAAAPQEGPEAARAGMGRRSAACCLIGSCCLKLGRCGEAADAVQEAVLYAPDLRSSLECRRFLAKIYLQDGRCEKAVDECDGILKEDPRYFSAYLIRQEAFFRLGRDQQTVQDYYRAVELYPGYYKPYLLAAEVFWRHRQYADGRKVLERAEAAGADFTPKMRLLRVRFLRMSAGGGEERREARRIAAELRKEMEEGTGGWDIGDLSEVDFELGMLLWEEHELDGAVHCLLRAMEANPGRRLYNRICGSIYLEKREYRLAIRQYLIASEEYGHAPELFYGLAHCEEELGETEEAIRYYLRTEELESGFRDTCEKLADYYKEKYETHWRTEDYDNAVKYSTRQLNARESSYNLVCRALIYALRDWELAVRDYERALELAPDDCIIWNNLGCVYKDQGQYEKALGYFQRAFETMGDTKVKYPYSNMGDCLHALGQDAQAVQWYESAAELWPENHYFYEKLGELYYSMGEYRKAMDYFRRTVESRGDAYSNMADIYLEQGDVRRCLALHREGIERSEGMMKTKRLRRMGELYMEKLLDYRKAIRCFERALDGTENPDDVSLLEEHIARCYYFLKKYRKAKLHAIYALDAICAEGRTLAGYVDYVSDGPARAATAGWLELCMGNRQQALDYFQKMEELRPCGGCLCAKGCYESCLNQGWVYEREGNYQKAMEFLKRAHARNPQGFCARRLMDQIRKMRG